MKLFEKIKAIENQLNNLKTALTKDSKIATFLENGSDEYGVILPNTACKKRVALTINDLEKAMKIQWQILGGVPNKKCGVKEFLLAYFQGTCYKCGQAGHKANQCANKKKEDDGRQGGETQGNGNNKPKFNGNCGSCGNYGKKATDCWYYDKNASQARDQKGLIRMKQA